MFWIAGELFDLELAAVTALVEMKILDVLG